MIVPFYSMMLKLDPGLEKLNYLELLDLNQSFLLIITTETKSFIPPKNPTPASVQKGKVKDISKR
jgi:hypothetical protein